MSEQTANGRNANGHRFRLYEIVLGVVLTAMFALLFASMQQLSNRMNELERKVEENSRILVEVQTTLKLIVSGLNIRVTPKDEEQAGPAADPADAPTPTEKLATKAP